MKPVCSDRFSELMTSSGARGESRDCVVKAAAIVCRMSYSDAHDMMRKAGRKNKQGMFPNIYMKAIKDAGFTATRVDINPLIDWICANDQNVQSLTLNQLGRHDALLPEGTYLVRTNGHALAYVDNKIHDWSKGRRMRIMDIYKIEKI
jgi:hypothetical protein